MQTFTVFSVVLIFLCGYTNSARETSQTRLMNDILYNYKPSLVPLKYANSTVTVHVAFTLSRVQKLEERSQTLESLGYINMRWVDHLLAWDPKRYDGIKSVTLHPDDIWLPGIQVLNSVEQPEDIALAETMRFRPTIQHDGTVTWSPAQKWNTFCAMDLLFFPFDTQQCEISIISFHYSIRKNTILELLTEKVRRPSSVGPTTGEWTLENAIAGKQEFILEDSEPSNETNKVSQLLITMTLTLSRASVFYIYNVVLPVVIVTQISTLVYFLPCQSDEKISFSITILLAYFVMLLMVSEIMPRSGTAVPYLTSYIALCMFLNGLSLLMTVVILNVYHHHPYSRVPACLRAMAIGCCGRILCLTPPRIRSTDKENIDMDIVLTNDGAGLKDINLDESTDTMRSSNGNKHTLQKQSSFTDEEIIQRNQEEWQHLAKIIDRIMFIISVVFITGITTVYFVAVQVAALTYEQLSQTIVGWVY